MTVEAIDPNEELSGQEVFNYDMYWEMMQKFIAIPNYRPASKRIKRPKLSDRVDKGAIDDLGVFDI